MTLTDTEKSAAARKSLEAALKIRTEIEEKSNAAATRLQLAALSIEEGNFADGERVAREVRDEYRKEVHPDDEIGADIVLLRALNAQKKYKEAEQELENANLLSAKSQNVPNRLVLGIAGARIRANAGNPDEAIQNLVATLRNATKSGFVPDQFEARLAHGEIELNSEKSGAGRAELGALQKDAAAKGFTLIAEKAKRSTAAAQGVHPGG